MEKGTRTFFYAGHARLPQGMAAQNMFKSLSIAVEIEPKYAVIIEASCTLATEHGMAFVRDLLRGHSLQDGIEELVGVVQQRYNGRACNALIAALKDLHLQYEKNVQHM